MSTNIEDDIMCIQREFLQQIERHVTHELLLMMNAEAEFDKLEKGLRNKCLKYEVYLRDDYSEDTLKKLCNNKVPNDLLDHVREHYQVRPIQQIGIELSREAKEVIEEAIHNPLKRCQEKIMNTMAEFAGYWIAPASIQTNRQFDLNADSPHHINVHFEGYETLYFIEVKFLTLPTPDGGQASIEICEDEQWADWVEQWHKAFPGEFGKTN
ncbi:hypothetical protein F4778DRAFT_749931 [Xylariomycetidae sp. FL2044]|nr:hypothetical protein F4778DRAFT_749931 [Xylariomycetidae sp. FL2044]